MQFDSSEPSRIPTVQKIINSSNAISTSMMSVGIFGLESPVCSPVGNAYTSNNNGNNNNNNNTHQAFTPRIPNSPRSLHTPTSSSNGINGRGAGAVYGTGPGSSPSGSIIGDVGEPFWIQLLHSRTPGVTTSTQKVPCDMHCDSGGGVVDGASLIDAYEIRRPDSKDCATLQSYGSWTDPDEQSMAEIKKYITATDKKIFWEMIKAIIDLPEITEFCRTAIKSSKDLATLLKKTEYRVLWTSEGADIIPKQIAADLVRAAYVPDPDNKNTNM